MGLFENCLADGVYDTFAKGIGKRGKEKRDAWFAKLAQYKAKYPDLATQLDKIQKRELPDGWDKGLKVFPTDAKGMGGRIASQTVLNQIAPNMPWMIGGAADLAPSTKTRMDFPAAGDFQAGSYAGRNLHFGIREHAMGAIMNGIALTKLRAYGSGFLIFSDYGRTPIRLAAIMEIPVTYIFTHDSIGVGEDGPTHQPIEQVASLRAIPGLITLRPGDANEVLESWKVIMKSQHEPICLILTREDLPTLDRTKYAGAEGVARGAYVLADAPGGKPDVLLLASGSTLSLCVDAYEKLKAEGVKARVVSMPSWEMFEYNCKQGSGIPRGGPAGVGDGARCDRAGFDVRLGALRRPDRGDHRHEDVWGVGAAEGTGEEVRVQFREHRRRRQGPGEAGEEVSGLLPRAVRRAATGGSPARRSSHEACVPTRSVGTKWRGSCPGPSTNVPSNSSATA